MSDVFVSYARKNRRWVKDLVGILEAEGFEVWWDRSLLGGESFDDAIQEALTAAKCVVVVWSRHSVKSRWVLAEAAEGADRSLLVPVLIEKVSVPLAFRRIQSVDLVDRTLAASQGEAAELIASIRRILARPTTEDRPKTFIRARPAVRDTALRGRLFKKWAILLLAAVFLILAVVFSAQSCRIEGGATGPSSPELIESESP